MFYTVCEEKCLHVSASVLPQKLISYLGRLVTGSEMGQKAYELQLLWDTAEASSRGSVVSFTQSPLAKFARKPASQQDDPADEDHQWQCL